MIINHGTFGVYTPSPEGMTPDDAERLRVLQSLNAIFARRADGADWYDLTRALPDGRHYAMILDGRVVSIASDAQTFGILDGMTLLESKTPVERGWHWDGVSLSPPTVDMAAAVNAERDRRIRSGFVWNGKSYQSDDRSRAAIMEAMTIATAAITAGKLPGDLRWSDPSRDFAWIAADNSSTLMDAQTCLAFGMAASDHKSDLVRAARAIKSLHPIPQDYTDDRHWT